jgi:hypothetical protein
MNLEQRDQRIAGQWKIVATRFSAHSEVARP